MSARVLVINSSSPELDQLALGLDEEGLLERYVRPYAYQGRWWERALARLPGMRGGFESSFGRRRVPAGLDNGRVSEAVVANDFAAAFASRVANKGWRPARALHSELIRRRHPTLARAAARHVTPATAVVGAYGVSHLAFARARHWGGLAILNYPITHHRMTQRVLEEEAGRDPEFASTQSPMSVHLSMMPVWDRELELADRVLVGSAFVARSFAEQGIDPAKVEVVPYGVDTELFHPEGRPEPTAPGPLRVVFAGSAAQRKGIRYLLEAVARYDAPIELTLVGSMPADRRPFKPYEGLFRFVPSLPRPQLAALFREQDVLVLPSFLEGMPLVVGEAMACGLPVVVTATGADQIVRDGTDGFIVPLRDPDAICESWTRLQQSPELRRSMGENARRRAEAFTWQAYRGRVVQTIARICDLPPTAPADPR